MDDVYQPPCCKRCERGAWNNTDWRIKCEGCDEPCKTGKRCPECGKLMYGDNFHIILSQRIPEQYHCKKCGYEEDSGFR